MPLGAGEAVNCLASVRAFFTVNAYPHRAQPAGAPPFIPSVKTQTPKIENAGLDRTIKRPASNRRLVLCLCGQSNRMGWTQADPATGWHSQTSAIAYFCSHLYVRRWA